LSTIIEAEPEPQKSLLDQYVQSAAKDKERKPKESKKVLGERDAQIDSKKLEEALAAEKNRVKGKRKHEQTEITEESLEAYRLTRSNREDPMANYVDKE
jgi:pre-mRNA-processing factor SLU7